MKAITKRELARKPSLVTSIKPGESVQIEDRQGGLVLMRQKRQTVSVGQMEAELDRLAAHCPAIDTKTFLEEGE